MRVFSAFAMVALGMLAACDADTAPTLTGYGEGEYLYLSAVEGGRIDALLVEAGDEVAADAPLARLDSARVDASLAAAGFSAEAARARSASVRAAAIRSASAEAERARLAFARTAQLHAEGWIADARFDEDKAALRAAEAQLAQARAEQIAASRETGAAGADERLARVRRADAAVRAPMAGRVERIFRREGEVVNAGEPILALLPPQNMKVRFFAPEASIAALPLGARVAIACDGCPDGLTGRVTFVAREPSYTAPIIYSRDTRESLVFLVEAAPSDPAAIRPGLPVDVRLSPERAS